MRILSNFLDRYRAKDFSLSPNKKIKTVQAEFKDNFGLTLRVYKGSHLADSDLTFAALNAQVSTDIKAQNADLVVKASMTIGQFEDLVFDHFGLKVQVANEFNTYLVRNKYTLGQASRKEDFTDWCKDKGFKSIDDWLKSEKCSSLEEYYKKQGKI
jgi:hypothetical protein